MNELIGSDRNDRFRFFVDAMTEHQTPNDQVANDATKPITPRRRKNVTSDLIQRIRESANQLEKDGSTRGDLKLLSRALRELRYAFKVFAPYRAHPKVTVFGSARTPSDDPNYQLAVAFGKAAAENEWFVITGAANGIMEAGHEGAGREMSMGLNILLPFETDANPIIVGDEKLVHMKYFFTRKLMFVKECEAVVCFPGGFGTLDETLEVLTLLQTGKREPVPVILMEKPGGTYWKTFHEFIKSELLGGGNISAEDFHLYMITSDVDEAVEEMIGFYRNYHSMRYVRDRLVFRLFHKPSDELIAELNRDFTDILHSGGYEPGEALPGEKDQPDLADLPRLVFHFNRRNHGRLRQLINRLNQEVAG